MPALSEDDKNGKASNVGKESLLLTDICELYGQKVLNSFETSVLPIREFVTFTPKVSRNQNVKNNNNKLKLK